MPTRLWPSSLVIPNQVLNLALKEVQGLSNSIYDFGISVLVFRSNISFFPESIVDRLDQTI